MSPIDPAMVGVYHFKLHKRLLIHVLCNLQLKHKTVNNSDMKIKNYHLEVL